MHSNKARQPFGPLSPLPPPGHLSGRIGCHQGRQNHLDRCIGAGGRGKGRGAHKECRGSHRSMEPFERERCRQGARWRSPRLPPGSETVRTEAVGTGEGCAQKIAPTRRRVYAHKGRPRLQPGRLNGRFLQCCWDRGGLRTKDCLDSSAGVRAQGTATVATGSFERTPASMLAGRGCGGGSQQVH